MSEMQEVGLREMLLSNEAFLRLVRGFEIYQKVYNDTDDEEEKIVIKERMRSQYGQKSSLVEDPEHRQRFERAVNARDVVFKLCEDGVFKKEDLVDMLLNFGSAENFLKNINHREGDVEAGTGHILVNSIIAYGLEKNDEVSLHIKPANVSNFEQLIGLVLEGFNLIANEMKGGKLNNIKNVQMESWLLGSAFGDKIKKILGNDVITTKADNSESMEEVQSLALKYNSRSLEKFLRTGEKPEVRQLIMTKEEFINKFATK
ncbi:MAG TPA: hypothetical protein PLV72_03155 [Candidatus Magasanikbacteria bacterium]|nr:hypothetical protein [Candidatus Magasanikbacteria bacterium]